MRNYIYRLFYNKYIALTVLVVIIALGLLFGTGAAFGQPAPEPQTATNTNTEINTGLNPTVEYRVIETQSVQYVDKPMTTIEYIDRVEIVYKELRNYKSLEELKQWLVWINNNTTTIYLQRPGDTIDCDDFALTLQQQAMEGGYRMSFQIIEPGEYNHLFERNKLPPDTLHAINLVVIGNNVYYIEPQTGEIVFAAQLD